MNNYMLGLTSIPTDPCQTFCGVLTRDTQPKL